LASKGNNLRDNKLCDTSGICEWGVEDGNPMLRCVFEVNLVGSNTETPYHNQAFGFTKNLRAEFGL
jgi:hypothetical protein